MRNFGSRGIIGVVGFAALVLPFAGSDYAVSFSIQLLVFLVLAYSWNLIGGYAGYTHFGQVSFFGVGAYVGSLLIFHWGVPWYAAAAVAGLAGAAVAIPLGGAMLRLKGPFFAIGMFGLARVLEAFALGFDSITGGGTGIYLKPLGDLRPLYYVVLAVAAIMVFLTWKLDNSRLGLKLLAIREDEDAAESLGIPTTRLKIGTFVASAIAPAAMGSLYAVYLRPSSIRRAAFASNIELTTIAMVLLGGMGTVLGPLVGAVALSVVNEVLWANYPQIYLASVGFHRAARGAVHAARPRQSRYQGWLARRRGGHVSAPRRARGAGAAQTQPSWPSIEYRSDFPAGVALDGVSIEVARGSMSGRDRSQRFRQVDAVQHHRRYDSARFGPRHRRGPRHQSRLAG